MEPNEEDQDNKYEVRIICAGTARENVHMEGECLPKLRQIVSIA